MLEIHVILSVCDAKVYRCVSRYLLPMNCVFVRAPIFLFLACTFIHLFPSACVRVCRRITVWCRPIKTEEIDDQGLRVVAAAEAAADSCFLQTTGNEMALFS